MENPSFGRELYREPANANVRMPPALAVAMAGYGVFVLLASSDIWSVLLGSLFVSLCPWVVFGAIALVPRRSVVYEHGVGLSVRMWAVWRGRARRFIPSQEITQVWPALHTWPGDPESYLRGYEVEYRGGRGRVVRRFAAPEVEAQLTEAMQTMLGSRWAEVRRPIPEITQELESRITEVVSRPLNWRNWKYLAGMLLVVGDLACGSFLGLNRWRPPLPLAWSLALFAAGGIVVAVAVALFASSIGEGDAADDTVAIYLQIREHERSTGARVLPVMRLHPYFRDTDPLGGRPPVDTAYLESGLRQRDIAILWGAAVVATAMCGGAVITALFRSYWLLVLAFLGALVFVPPCARAASGYRGAKGYLMDLIHDEWKTKEQVLPAGFPVPPRFQRLREPARLTAAYPRRIAAANRLGWFAEFLPMVLLFGVLFAWMVPFLLDVPWPIALTVLVLAMAAAGASWRWIEDGRVLRDCLTAYEELTA